MMLDKRALVDAHVHVPHLGTLSSSWRGWAEGFGSADRLRTIWGPDGTPDPARLDAHLEDEGVDVALLFCEYSPRTTGYQVFDDLLPLVEHNPRRMRPVASVNPHLHYPIGRELKRQLDHGAAALKLHPVHGGFRMDDTELFPAYAVLEERGVPLVVHCGTSTFPGSMNEYADPELLYPVLRSFPGLNIILAHGGRGWWYDSAAFMAQAHDNVWIELAGLPPKRLPHYYAKYDIRRLARKFIFATDWPGVPSTSRNARAMAELGLDEETLVSVLSGNARSLYAGIDIRDRVPDTAARSRQKS